MRFRWPQITMFVFMGMCLGYALALDGQPHKYPISFAGETTVWIILLPLLYWGGFFDKKD